MNYLIGIDGGATNTCCVITDLDYNIIHECKSGPANLLVSEKDKLFDTVFNLINDCKNKLLIDDNDIGAIGIAMAGAGRVSQAEKFKNDFYAYSSAKGFKIRGLIVDTDARASLEGAFKGGCGAILISGTGSIILGKDNDGNIHRAGGYGRLIGDEGSGYSIGRKGLKAISRMMDGRCLSTQLYKLVADKFNIASQENLINAVYLEGVEIPSVAPLVIEAAQSGDEICSNIVDEECEELILHVRALADKLKLDKMPLVFNGSIISTENFLSKRLKEKLNKTLPFVEIRMPEYPPAVGAAIIARNNLKIKM